MPASENDTICDLESAGYRADPFPTYARMRREAPIYAVDEDGPLLWNRGRVWYFFRYSDTAEVLRDPELFVKDYRLAFTPEEIGEMPPAPYFVDVIFGSLINKEGREHTRLRKLVNLAFSTARVESRRDTVRQITEELLDRVVDRGRMDLLRDFAYELPVTVITDILGLPRSDVPGLQEWANDALVSDPEILPEVDRRMEKRFTYLREVFARRRREPRDDLTSALLKAEVDGEKLDDHEMLAMLGLLIGAGFETTMNLISNSIRNLLRHPGELERLRRQPALLETAVEELLRFEGPLYTATPRWAARDVDFQGHRIRRGDRLLPVLLSANRDGEHFSEPDRLDLGRRPNRHVAFGVGVHFCVGGPLARLETQVALSALMKRLPGLRLDVGEEELRWVDSRLFRGLERLPIVWD